MCINCYQIGPCICKHLCFPHTVQTSLTNSMGLMCKGKFVGLGSGVTQFYPCFTRVEGAALHAWNQVEVHHRHQQVAYPALKMRTGGQFSGKIRPLLKEILLLSCVVMVMKTEAELNFWSDRLSLLYEVKIHV